MRNICIRSWSCIYFFSKTYACHLDIFNVETVAPAGPRITFLLSSALAPDFSDTGRNLCRLTTKRCVRMNLEGNWKVDSGPEASPASS
jgi:hypothetical protein